MNKTTFFLELDKDKGAVVYEALRLFKGNAKDTIDVIDKLMHDVGEQ